MKKKSPVKKTVSRSAPARKAAAKPVVQRPARRSSAKANTFAARVKQVRAAHEAFFRRRNPVDPNWDNGVFERFQNPVVTYQHAPLEWRYDFNPETNPFFMERLGVNAALNPGAFYWKGKVHLVVRTEGYDRKSFFSIVESPNGIDNFRFWEEPVDLPEFAGETHV